MKKINSLKAALADSVDNSHSLIDRIGSNPEQANNQTNLNELFKLVDNVPANDVNNVCFLCSSLLFLIKTWLLIINIKNIVR